MSSTIHAITMRLPSIVRPFVIIAAGSGAVQSTAWLVLACLSVISSQTCVFEAPLTVPSQVFSNILVNVYFLLQEGALSTLVIQEGSLSTLVIQEGSLSTLVIQEGALSTLAAACNLHMDPELPILKSYQVFIWSIIYIVLSIVWLCASIYLFLFVTTQRIKHANMAIYTWCLITLGLSSVDIALGILFGQDYFELGSTMDLVAENGLLFMLQNLRLAAGLLSVVALRGFILLAINLALLVFLFYCTFKISNELNKSVHTTTLLGPIHGYGTVESGLNRSMSQRGIDNASFDFNEDLMIPRSNSWHQGKVNPHPPMRDEPSNIKQNHSMPRSQPALSSFQSNNHAVEQQPWRPAKPILKPIAMKPTAPTAPNHPSLPTPDYSPPSFRRLKSALKSTGPV